MSNAVTVARDNNQVVAKPKPPLTGGGQIAALVPQDFEQAWRVAQVISHSGMAPRDMQTPEKLVVSIMHGLEIGLPPMQAIQSIAVVNGRPTVWGDGALGLVRGSGHLEDFEERLEGEGDALRAVCRCNRKGQATPIIRTFSVAEARKAGLWGKSGPWSQYPQRMLAMRARAFALRDGFADVLKGIGITEEVHDYSGLSMQEPAQPSITAAALKQQAGVIDGEAREVSDTVAPAPQGAAVASGESAQSPAAAPTAEQATAGEILDEAWQALVRGYGELFMEASTREAFDAVCRDWEDRIYDPDAVPPPEAARRQVATFKAEAAQRLGKRK